MTCCTEDCAISYSTRGRAIYSGGGGGGYINIHERVGALCGEGGWAIYSTWGRAKYLTSIGVEL